MTKVDKKHDRQISSMRIRVENIIQDVKIFKILPKVIKTGDDDSLSPFQSNYCYL